MKKIVLLGLFALAACSSSPNGLPECSDNGIPFSGQTAGMIAGAAGGGYLANGRTSNSSANTTNTIGGAVVGGLIGSLTGGFFDDNSKMKCRVAMQSQQLQQMQRPQYAPSQFPQQSPQNYYTPTPGFFPHVMVCPNGYPGQPSMQTMIINGQPNTIPGVLCQ